METSSFYSVAVGNIFYIKNKSFIKWNDTQAFSNETKLLTTIPASQYVDIKKQHNVIMAA
jgi:hypothetical protein